uniref:Uncharacterized protein n=1 Tax=Arundo donax TaxID=35708 RepID=A0A0A8YYE9_ARUDO
MPRWPGKSLCGLGWCMCTLKRLSGRRERTRADALSTNSYVYLFMFTLLSTTLLVEIVFTRLT